MRPLDDYIKEQLTRHLDAIGDALQSDAMAIVSPIVAGLDGQVRDAIDKLAKRKKSICIILHTNGGVVEVVERMVETIRHFYDNVIVVVPDAAMSAGTILALSADRIMMDYFSCLGPIDPQIEKDGRLVPALSYLKQFERLNEKATLGTLTTAEYALLSKLDLGELYQFEQARELSKELLIKWLTKYKFKDWTKTATRGIVVTEELRKVRALEIADELNKPERWHSHGRGIVMETLQNELGLQIEDYTENVELATEIRKYFELLKDYMMRGQMLSFVHTREYF